MRRRSFVGTCGAVVLGGVAGCASRGSNTEPSQNNTNQQTTTTPNDYVTEIGFESRSSTSSQMYATVTEEVAQINVIKGDGSQFASATVPTGASKINIQAVGTFREQNLEFIVLDSEKNELDSFTRDFEPRLEFRSFEFTGTPSDWLDMKLMVTLANTGNAPIVVAPLDAQAHLPGTPTDWPNSRWDKEDVERRLSTGQTDGFQSILPGKTTSVEAFLRNLGYRFTVERTGDKAVFANTDVEWNESEACHGETYDWDFSVWDTSGEAHNITVPMVYSGGAELIHSDTIGFSKKEEVYVCSSIEAGD